VVLCPYGGLLTNTALTSGVFAAITGLGAQSQTLDMGANIIQFNNANETIQILSSIMTFDVADTFSHAFRINNVNELTITGTAINAPTAVFQEAGIEISPIGDHDQYLAAGAFDEVTAGAVATRIVDGGDDRKVLRYIPFTNGVDQFATIMFQAPRNFDNGTITAIFHWTNETEGSGVVRWGIAAAAIGDGQDYNTVVFGSEVTVDDTQTTADFEHLSPRTAAVTIGNTPADTKMIVIRARRLGAAAGDTFDQIAQLLGMDVELTTDRATATD